MVASLAMYMTQKLSLLLVVVLVDLDQLQQLKLPVVPQAAMMQWEFLLIHDLAIVEQIVLQYLLPAASSSSPVLQLVQHFVLVLVELESADQTNWITSSLILSAAAAKFSILHVKYPAPDVAFRWI